MKRTDFEKDFGAVGVFLVFVSGCLVYNFENVEGIPQIVMVSNVLTAYKKCKYCIYHCQKCSSRKIYGF
jgi:hypothetical protein